MKRLLEFDFIKLFAIFLVLWGHCTQYFISAENHVDEPVYRLIYTFHMPLFIMVSGFFATSSLKKQARPFIVNKALQLLLPCLTWGSLFYLILLTISDPGKSYGSFLDHNLWFLKCLFACYLIYYIIFKNCPRFLLASFLSLGIAFLIPDRYIQTLFPYFFVGILLQRYFHLFTQHLYAITTTSVVLFTALSCYNTTDVYWSRTPLSYVLGLTGALSVIGLVFLVNSKRSLSPLVERLAHFGQYTLGVYILQSFILEKLMPQYINFDALPSSVINFVIHPLLSLVLLVVCIAITRLVDRNKYLALIFFGKRF